MQTLVISDLIKPSRDQEDVYYLGSWCFLDRIDERIARLSGKIIPYHWDDRDKLSTDFVYLQKLNNELIKELTNVLNKIHSLNENEKFWRILLGYWLNICTAVVFDRWASLKRVSSHKQTFNTTIIKSNKYSFIASDTVDFIRLASESSIWNHSLFSLLVEYFPEIQSSEIEISSNRQDNSKLKKAKKSVARWSIDFLAGFCSARLKCADSYFLMSTYLPYESMIELELKLGQIPLPNLSSSYVQNVNINSTIRKWKLPSDSCNNEFGNIIRDLLPKLIPKVFVEGFANLMQETDKVGWARSPKIIFTSNRHFTDEVFKAWAATKVAKGARLLIGEHGGLGVGKFNGAHAYELSIADKYLSSGWSDDSSKIIPVGNLRIVGKVIKPDKIGKALMVLVNMPRFSFDIRSMALSSQMLEYFESQFKFVDLLSSDVREKILVRLYPTDYGWQQKERWLDRHPNVDFDDGVKSMFETAKNCRLFIGTYAATSYIDMLALNFPTVMFWNPEHWEVKDDARNIFDLMKQAGIFHETPQSAAVHVSKIWNNISEWWCSEAVQHARQIFCNVYSSSSPDLIDSIKKIVIDPVLLSDSENKL